MLYVELLKIESKDVLKLTHFGKKIDELSFDPKLITL